MTPEEIQAQTPEGAVAGRVGGDEFLVLAPVKTEKELEAIAEAVREEARTITVMGGSYDEVPSDPVTLTLGLSCLPHHGTDLKSLWMAAEAAATHGKEAGRDRIVWAETP